MIGTATQLAVDPFTDVKLRSWEEAWFASKVGFETSVPLARKCGENE